MANAWAKRMQRSIDAAMARRRSSLPPVIAFVLACSAVGQSLRITPSPAPPPIADGGFAAALGAELDAELEELRRTVQLEAQEGDPNATAAAAMMRYRELAVALLARGEATDPDGHAAALAGAALWSERSNLDALLRVLQQARSRPAVNPERAADHAEAAAILRRFSGQPNDVLVDLTRREPRAPSVAWHSAISQFVAPLAAATALMTGHEIRDPWVAPAAESLEALAAAGWTRPVSEEPAPTVEALHERVRHARLPPALQQEFIMMLDLIERGSAFPEFQPATLQWQQMLDEMLRLHAAVREADWLPRTSRAEFEDAGAELLQQARERATVAQIGLQRERLAIAQRLITRVNTLRDLQVSAIRLSAVMRVIDHRAPGQQSVDAVRRRAERLERVLDRMITVRALPPITSSAVPPATVSSLEARYARAEDALLTALARLATDDAALADPAMSTLLAGHRQAAEDLQRLREMDEWAGVIGMIRPGGGEAFIRFIRRLLDWLVDPMRRADAVPLIDQFNLERRLFIALPFERILRSDEETTIVGSPEQRAAMLAAIEQQRDAWARAWTEGIGHTAASERLILLRRLLLAMQDAHATGVDRGRPVLRRLNRWPCWLMPPDLLERMTRDLIGRIGTAIPTALREEPVTFARELERLERATAVARLAGRLLTVLSDELAAEPSGLMGALNGLVHPPGATDWPAGHRHDLAEISRYVLEAAHAFERGRSSRADAALRYANARAAELLLEFGDHPDPPPTLRGFNDD